ncbi:MAG TPA: SRPBCC family protein, partial [Mycobacterium sp.]|nr:SRPBCC family protein [Mycobacterium sp.]
MFPCERVDLSFTDEAPHVFRNSVDLAVTPEQLFEVLADAE